MDEIVDTHPRDRAGIQGKLRENTRWTNITGQWVKHFQ
jgi:hypothetical protein